MHLSLPSTITESAQYSIVRGFFNRGHRFAVLVVTLSSHAGHFGFHTFSSYSFGKVERAMDPNISWVMEFLVGVSKISEIFV